MADIASLGRILVVVPTYNELDNLESIVARIRAAVPTADILVADDNSPDGTGDLADRMALSDGHIHVLHRAGKEGLARAYVAGFTWGLERNYDVFVELDADGSHQPEQLPMLLRALLQADMVKGSRWINGGSVVNWDKKRELLSRAANIWVMAAMNLPIHDSTGGYNLYRADILRQIRLDDIDSLGYSFQVDMTRRVLEAGGRVGEVPIEFMEREHGVSKMSGNIVSEALFETAKWGFQRRTAQFRGFCARLAEKMAPLTDKIKSSATPDSEVPTDSTPEPRPRPARAAEDTDETIVEPTVGAARSATPPPAPGV